jgi:hypothetical protein
MDELQDERLAAADPETRALGAHELLVRNQEIGSELSRIRREALNELIAGGTRQTEVASLLGITKARVGQLLHSGPQPERALLGTAALSIAVGGKHEAQKINPSAVISAEALGAYRVLADLADGYGLQTGYEVVPPPGMVDLNRANLVVLGSPRLLPFVSQVLAADQHLGFQGGAQGWYLVDRTARDGAGGVYRSPSDSGVPSDYAYIGRLPRPDGRGTFLYLAGIHAMGTLGAAHYLADHIEELYKEVRNNRWSTLIECRYDPDTREIMSCARLTPVYLTT